MVHGKKREKNARDLNLLKAAKAQVIFRNEMKKGYMSLCAYVCFIMFFTVTLFFQRSSSTAFSVDDTLKGVLFSSPYTSNFDGSISESIANPEDFYHWLSSTILTVFKDAVCGDGVCEGSEAPLYARWGCFLDCGAYSPEPGEPGSLINNVHIDLHLKPPGNGLTDRKVFWNVCSSQGSNSPFISCLALHFASIILLLNFHILSFLAEHVRCYYKDTQVLHDGTNYPNPFHPAPSVESVSVILPLIDADWELTLTAPNGGVYGKVWYQVTNTSLELWRPNQSRRNASAAAAAAALKKKNFSAETVYVEVTRTYNITLAELFECGPPRNLDAHGIGGMGHGPTPIPTTTGGMGNSSSSNFTLGSCDPLCRPHWISKFPLPPPQLACVWRDC